MAEMLRELEDIVLIAIVRHKKTKDRCPVSCEGKKKKMILMLYVCVECDCQTEPSGVGPSAQPSGSTSKHYHLL